MIDLLDFRDGSECAVLLCRDGSEFKTGDSMGMVYSLKKGDSEMNASTVGDDGITALACKPNGGGEYAVAHGNVLGIFSADLETEKLGMAVRRTLMITHVDYDVGGNHVLVASQEPGIQVFNTVLQTVEFTISTKDIGVRMFRQSSDGSKIAVLDENGAVSIYELQISTGVGNVRSFTGKDSLTTITDVVSKEAARAYKRIGCSVSWHPSESRLAVPSKDGSLMIFSQNALSADGTDWDEDLLVMSDEDDKRHGCAAVMVAWSPNGKFIASADVTGTVLIWDVNEKEAIAKHSCGAVLCDLAWGENASDNYLLVLAADAYAFIDNAVPDVDKYGTPTEHVVVAKTTKNAAAVMTTESEERTDEVEATQLDNDSGSNDEVVPEEAKVDAEAGADAGAEKASATKHKSSGQWSAAFGTDEANKDDDKPGVLPGDLDLGGNEDDQGLEAMKASLLAAPNASAGEEVFDDASLDGDADAGGEGDGMEVGEGEEAALAPVPVELQRAFQPSSTNPDERRRRFMVWNAFGHIISRDDRMTKRVDMALLRDSSGRRREESFTDNYGFTRGTLGPQGAAFADDGGRDAQYSLSSDDQGATVFYYAFSGYQMNETFTTSLPKGEGVDAIAVGSGWVAVATTKQLLRVFSATGLQLFMCWLKGPVVALVGSGMQLAVFYHAAPPCNGSFNLRVDVLEFGPETSFRQITEVAVPVAMMKWCGVCPNNNYVAVMDDQGVLSVLMKSCGWQWMPVLDARAVRKNHDDEYWPICIVDGHFEYALLKGEYQPVVYPLPTTASKEFCVPVVHSEKSKSKKSSQGSVDIQNCRYQHMVWEQAQASHTESIKAELDPLLIMPDGYSLAELEERVAQQATMADTAVLKLLQDACKLQKIALSFDLAKRLRTVKACQTAIQIANHFGKPALAFALEDALRYKQDLEQAMEQNQEEAEEAERLVASRSTSAGAGAGAGAVSAVSPEGENVRRGLGGALGTASSPQDSAVSVVTPGMGGSSRRSVTFSDNMGSPPRGSNSENAPNARSTASPSPSDHGKRPANKFARALNKSAGSGLFSPKRDRDVHLSSASASPSPNKTPKLLRQSSYADEVRSNLKQQMSSNGYI